MEHYIALIGIAVGLFATTNIDDIFVLLGFFSNPKFQPRQVVLGQYIGITILFGASVVGSLITLVLSPVYVGLLGLIPIMLGLKALWEQRKRTEGSEGDLQIATPADRGNVMAVAAITIANGSDNISIYVPIFSLKDTYDIALIGVIFIAMTAIWIVAAHWLTNHKTIGAPIRRYGHRVVPFVLIVLGLLILYESSSLSLISM